MRLYRFLGLPDNRMQKNKVKRQLHFFLQGIKRNELYLQNPLVYNDPFDSKALFHNLTDADMALLKKIRADFIETEDDPVSIDVFKRLPLDILPTNRFRTCCFASENIFQINDYNIKYSDLMWAHYANNHYGICLEYEFDKDNLLSNFIPQNGFYIYIKRTKGKDDMYNPQVDNQSPPGFKLDICQMCYDTVKEISLPVENIDKALTEILTTKPESWKFEKEVRIIAQAPNRCAFSSKATYYLKYKPICLKKIIFGYRTTEYIKKQVAALVADFKENEIILKENRMRSDSRSFYIDDYVPTNKG